MSQRRLIGIVATWLVLAGCAAGDPNPASNGRAAVVPELDGVGDDAKRPPPRNRSDATAPSTQIVSAPAPLTSATIASFKFTGSDDEGVSSYRCRLNGNAASVCASPASYAALADGAQVFSVQALDAAGNADPTPATYAWVVDTTPPETALVAAPAAVTGAATAGFSFSGDDTNDVKGFQCNLDGAPFAACVSPVVVEGLTAGSHTFMARAIDAAGNIDPTPINHAWSVTLPEFVANVLWTERLGQLVGTSRSPYHQIGLKGTDLGVAFPLGDQVALLFGDSWTLDGADWDVDSIAFADRNYPADLRLPRVDWATQLSGRFLPLTISGVNLGGMNVPVDGFAAGVTTYVFFSTGYSGDPARHTHSVLAHATGADFGRLTLDHIEASDKFININAVVEGDTAYLFGSGPYRASPIYLARAPVTTIADRGTWRYYQSGSGAMAVFGPLESSAAILVGTTDVGEFSVRKHPRLDLYLMTYQTGGAQRGVHLRTATAPAGPWSAPLPIWNPTAHGYTYFMHAAANIVGYDDGLSEPGRENVWGGEYGPYLVPEWFDTPGTPYGAYSLTYVLSSWNPYTVHLIRTVLGPAGLASQPVQGAGLAWPALTNADFSDGLNGWTASGSTFSTFSHNAKTCVTTYTASAGDAATGTLWQEFTVNDSVAELRFQVHGGHAAVKLIAHGDEVFVTRGRDTNAADTPVRWKLGEYRGQTVRLVIDDSLTEPWGFISVCGFSFH